MVLEVPRRRKKGIANFQRLVKLLLAETEGAIISLKRVRLFLGRAQRYITSYFMLDHEVNYKANDDDDKNKEDKKLSLTEIEVVVSKIKGNTLTFTVDDKIVNKHKKTYRSHRSIADIEHALVASM